MFNATVYSYSVTLQLVHGLDLASLQATTVTELERHYVIPSVIRLLTLVWASIITLGQIIRKREDHRLFSFYSGWIGACILIFGFDMFAYQAEFADRYLMFGYLMIPILVAGYAMTKGHKHKSIMAVMVLLALANASTSYYFENYWIISDSNIEAARFLAGHSDGLSIVGHRMNALHFYQPDIDYIDLHTWVEYREDPWGIGKIMPRNSIVIFDSYTNSSKYASYYLPFQSMYYGRSGDNRVYDNEYFHAHCFVLV